MLMRPVAADSGSLPEPRLLPPEQECNFAQLAGVRFAFPVLSDSLLDGDFVLWRRRPSLLAEPLSAGYGGRQGVLSGAYFYAQGERWFPAQLEDCSYVYAMDTSAHADEGPFLHLQSVGRVYFLQTLSFARSLVGQVLRVRSAGLEPNHRLYTPSKWRSFPLFADEPLTVLGVETRRYGHTKGLGGFYLEVRNEAGQEGLIKFHHDYLQGRQRQPLWELQQDWSAPGALVPARVRSKPQAAVQTAARVE